jgi:anti-sigma B factor antagonist
MWTLRLAVCKDDGGFRLILGGRFGAASAPRVSTALAEAIDRGERHIFVDLSQLDYISSRGLLALEAAAARVAHKGGQLQVSGAQGAVLIALELAGSRSETSGAG